MTCIEFCIGNFISMETVTSLLCRMYCVNVDALKTTPMVHVHVCNKMVMLMLKVVGDH